MKILHTADLHLRSEKDERWGALAAVIEIGKKQKVDALVIAGDLFDSAKDAGDLYVKLRPVFAGAGFPTLILPGNHDHDSYPQGIFLGEDVFILSALETPVEIGGVRFFGLPFVPRERRSILMRLHSIREQLTPDKTNILVYHGELLDKIFERSDLGDEEAERYMPTRLAYFADLNINYVLAGHFHTSFDILRYGDGFFVYPGSPVSVTKRETGRRSVNLFTVGKPPAQLFLDTPHFVREEIVCDPFSDENPIAVVKERMGGLGPNATPLLSVTGFIDGKRLGTDETKLLAEIKKAAGKRAVVDGYTVRDISTILTDELFAAFNQRLAAQPDLDDERRERITRMVIEAMMEAAR